MIKFKLAGSGLFIRYSTDENGNKLPKTVTGSFGPNNKPKTSGAGMYQEYLKWIEDGNTVEPQYTVEELAVKEAKEVVDIQLSINSVARSFLNANDWKLLRHIRQEKRLAMGKTQEMSLSDQEFEDLLEECERQASLVVDPQS